MKLRIIPAAILIAIAEMSGLKAATVLPTMKAADDFNGSEVANLDKFVPTTADYTLEVAGSAGTPIHIGFGNISYTPVADGILRFVQHNGKIYIFENDTYTTTLIPTYNYTETGTNILRNGSFENVDEQLASGRWKATEWETWDGGTPTWGGDVNYVNVRENANYRSDGTKSIILHSRSRYLSQQLTANSVEPGAIYRLSCDYWTSDGNDNGGITYQLLLGSTLAGNDILTAEGYTTLNNDHSQQSFTTIIQMPQSLPDELYFSFYRTESRVDWLDNVQLTKIQPTATGITGVTKAIYATGAYTPENMILPNNVSIDMTSSITNPNFDDNLKGWTLTANTQSKISTAEKGGGFIAANQNHWQLWQSSGTLTGKAYQTTTNLPNGKYALSADIVTTSFGGSISLYANYGKTAVTSNTAKHYTVTGIVTNGTLEIGLDLATTSGVTIDFDTFTLQYLGMDTDGYREVLSLKINAVRQTLEHIEDGFDTTILQTALTAAETLPNDATANDIIAVIAAIDTAMNEYNAYVEEREAERKQIKHFTELIIDAKAERDADTYPGITIFDEAINVAETYLTELKVNFSAVSHKLSAQRDALNIARENYYNSQYTIAPVQQNISHVDLTLNGSEKFVLRVDNKPFYGTEIQLRPDKLRGYEGWNEQEIEAVFKRAADDGFNAVSVPLFWSEVELEKNHFDWRILDRYLGWCKKYDMKMELLWFSWSSGGRVQYLWNYDGKQVLRTPDYVCSADGTSEFNMLRTEWEYSLDWRDTSLRDRDTYVLSRIMEHIALWDANNGKPHTVIGVQLGNEARSHGNNSATNTEIIDYYHHVGAAVKQSKYVTWTRLNCVSWETSGRTNANEQKRNNGGTNIDFVGVDIYGTNASKVKGNLDGYLGENGKNFRMIMEIDAKDSNSPLYQMAALAGNKAFDYYNMGPVDGNGLYSNSGHTLTERSHINLVRQRNKILNLANQDIALKKHGNSLYVYNYAGNSTKSETGIYNLTFTPNVATTQAIAIAHNANVILLLSTSTGTFSWSEDLNVIKAERGYMDDNNEWVSEGEISISTRQLAMPATSCVRLLLEGAPIGKIINPSFDSNDTGWTITYDGTANPKISTVAKPQESTSPLIAGGQPHLQIWDINATGQITQTVEGLPDGQYEIGVTVCHAGNVSLTLFANDDEKVITADGRHTMTTNVCDGRVRIGLRFASNSNAVIDVDDFTLASVTTGIKQTTVQEENKNIHDEAIFDLCGRRIVNPEQGIYIKNGKKFFVKHH